MHLREHTRCAYHHASSIASFFEGVGVLRVLRCCGVLRAAVVQLHLAQTSALRSLKILYS